MMQCEGLPKLFMSEKKLFVNSLQNAKEKIRNEMEKRHPEFVSSYMHRVCVRSMSRHEHFALEQG